MAKTKNVRPALLYKFGDKKEKKRFQHYAIKESTTIQELISKALRETYPNIYYEL